MTGSLLLAGLTLAFPGPAHSASPFPALQKELSLVSLRFGGRLGVYVRSLKTGEEAGVRETERFPSASTIKTAVMAVAMQQVEEGKLRWDERIKLWEKPRRHASLWAYYMDEGLSVDVDGLIHLMMSVSDNTATVVLAERLGSPNIEKTLLGWGLKETAWTSYPPAENQRLVRLRQTFANMGVTTPKEMGFLIGLIAERKLVSPDASEKMIRIMGAQYWDDGIRWAVPSDVMVASKVGALTRSRSDIAIVFGPHPYLLTIYTDAQKDRRWAADNEGDAVIRKVSGLVWNRLNPERPYHPDPRSLRWAPTGGNVGPSGS